MPFNTTLLYTNTKSLTFDIPYYLSHHFPLVSEKWGPHGLLDWKIVQFQSIQGKAESSNESELPYRIQAILTWRDKDSFTEVMASEDWKTVFDDVPNFCNEMPLMLVGNIIGSS